jgi:UDP-N-acetylglucosamine 2-epimerase (non-hydrolysing)
MNKAKEFYERQNIKIDDNTVLITVHRRENHGERIDRILEAIEFLVKEHKDHSFIIPVHPNPNVKCKVYSKLGEYEKNIETIRGVGYKFN